jgi:thiosulfate dehydrogenase
MRRTGFRASLLAAALAAAAPARADDDLVQRGAYLARLGDCAACHTAEGGKPMAGGLALATPAGTIYSTNITPDANTGIGRYTLEQFDRALRRGLAADGRRLYPAMPYPSFAKISDADIAALYAYFTRGVAPVAQADRPADMRFPFNIRAGLALWSLLFLDTKPFAADPAKNASWNRGAYIVQGLGHCGACHTPRGLAFQEKAGADDGRNFLAGATLDDWRAPSLRNLASPAEVAQVLKTGAAARHMAFGPMTRVIHDSTQYFTDSDLRAVADYLTALAPKNAAPPAPARADDKALYATRGGLGYAQFCMSCHKRDGLGAPDIFPALAGNASVLSRDPVSLVHLVLAGGASAETRHSPHKFEMPAFARLADEEIAEILTFARNSWGNDAAAVKPEQVGALREKLRAPPPAAKTPLQPRLADLLDRPESQRLIFGARLMLETRAMLPKNVGNALDCASCHLNGGTVAKAAPFFGLTQVFPAENARAGTIISIEDRINGCFRRSEAGAPLPQDSPEMRAMVAFMASLDAAKGPDGEIEGRGIAKIDKSLKPDAARGERLYQQSCAVCHGEHGAGVKDADGGWTIPPLWGAASFNLGAGMARAFSAAGFIKANMPIAHAQNFPQGQGGLADQDALDIAQFFTHRPRPDFAGKDRDWPQGGKPPDARY